MTARKDKLPTVVDFLNACKVMDSVAATEVDPRRCRLFRIAAKHLWSAALLRANGSRQKVAQRHRWAIANVQKALFLRGGGA